MGNKAKVLVCQHGARHRYAIPRMLEHSEMLASLYTDSCAVSFFGRLARLLGAGAPLSVKRLASREVTGVAREKIYTTDKATVMEFIQKMFNRVPQGMDLFEQRSSVLSAQYIRWGLSDANVVYSMYFENMRFLQWAKERGIKCALDVYMSPVTEEIIRQESQYFPDWSDGLEDVVQQKRMQLWLEASELADLLICPSEWVAEGVRRMANGCSDKIRIVPYGCSIDYHGRVNKPIKGRVLFAGGDALRKGLHYLGQAASLLKHDLKDLDVRVAGLLPDHVVHHPVCRDLNFLGKLTSKQLQEEYLCADVFILPSLSEGFAGVVAEAIGAGCPVIVTREAGSPVVNEREGLVIESRNHEAIADAIKRMVSDRTLRDRCCRACLKQAEFYSEKEWEKRLAPVLKHVCL